MKAALLLLAALCAGGALGALGATCQIDVPLQSTAKMGVGGVFQFASSIPWPVWGWNKTPVTPSVRVTFPWSGASCSFTSSDVVTNSDNNWVNAAAGARVVPTTISATGEMLGKYGGWRAGFGGWRYGRGGGSYDVNFSVKGFQFSMASGTSNVLVSSQPTRLNGMTASSLAGSGTLSYNIASNYGLGTGSGSFAFDLTNRTVSVASGCKLAFRPAPQNDVFLTCPTLKLDFDWFTVNGTGTPSTVNIKNAFCGYKFKGSAPITAATTAI